MLTFKTYLKEEYYTFESYCSDVDVVAEYVFSSDGELVLESFSAVKREIAEIFKLIKDHFAEAGAELRLSASQIASAFKTKSVYESLKYFGFSFQSLFRAIQSVTAIPSDSLVKLFEDIRSLEGVKSLEKRGEMFDQFLEDHPIIKRLTGPIIAALLILTWLNMTFTGNLKHDMNITSWFKSLGGQFSIKDLFVSSQGMTMVTFLLTGLVSGGALSFIWLGASVYNLTLAFAYVMLSNAGVAAQSLRKVRDHILNMTRRNVKQ